MQVTISFNPLVAEQLEAARTLINGYGGQTFTGTVEETVPQAVNDDAERAAAEKKANDAAKAKKEAEKKAKEEAKAKAEEEAKAKAAAEEKAKAEAGPSYSLEDVRAKLKEYAAIEGKDAAVAILKRNGAASISELDPGKFAAVVKEATIAKKEEEEEAF